MSALEDNRKIFKMWINNYQAVFQKCNRDRLNDVKSPNGFYAFMLEFKNFLHNSIHSILTPNKQNPSFEYTIRQYVPGYTVITEPIYENGRLTTTIGVVGAADYLPSYAGNLDIITSASVEIARLYVNSRKISK